MKMKILKLVVLFLLIIQVKSFAQVAQEWVAFYHRDASKGNSLGIDSLGNIIISGTSGLDWITIKYSANGDTLWEQLLESPNQGPNPFNQNYEMALDPWGNAVVVGTAYDDSTWKKHWCVAKYNSIDGHEEWIEYMFNPYQNIDDDALDVAIDSRGRAIVAGVIFDGTYTSQGTGFDWIVKSYTSSGGTHWFDQFDNGTTGDAARRVVCTKSGIAYVCGTTQDTTHTFKQVKVHKYNYYGPDWDKHINVMGDEPQPQIAIDKNQNVFLAYDDGRKYTSNEIILIKYDSLGTFRWQKTISTPGSFDNYVVDIKTDSEGDVVFTGIYKDESGYFRCQTVKYSADGDSLWMVTEGEGTYPQALVIDAENNIYVAGKIPEMVVKYGPNGNEIWREGYLSATARDIDIDDHGNIFVTGYYSYDIITIKYSQAVGVEQELEILEFEIYPNPAAEKFQVTGYGFQVEDATIELYDLNGRKLLEKPFPARTENTEIDVSHLKNGVYFCRLVTKKYIATKKLIIQK